MNPFRRAAESASAAAAAPGEGPAAVDSPRPITGRLELRPLTGFEEELLYEGTGDNVSALCNEVLARCLVAPGEEPGAARDQVACLSVAERDRELARLRQISLGDAIDSVVVCPRCEAANEVGFSLGDLPLDFDPPPREIECELPDGSSATLRTPTAGDQAEFVAESAAAEASAAARSLDRSRWLARLLARLGERSAPIDADAVRALPVSWRNQLEAALERALPDFDLSMEVDCSDCGERFVAPFELNGFFLLS